MKLYAAAFSHDYGLTIRVLQSEESAKAWKIEIAKSHWDEFYDSPPDGLSDEEIADKYFDESHVEFFAIDEVEVEP